MRWLAALVLWAIPLAAGAGCPGRVSTANAAIGVGQLGETAMDCGTTVRILKLPNGQESNPLVPAFVTQANRAAHPGACFLGGTALVGVEFALLHCASPFYMGIGFVGEAINISLNLQVLKGK